VVGQRLAGVWAPRASRFSGKPFLLIRGWRRIALVVAVVCLSTLSSGCATHMALRSPESRPVVTRVRVDGAKAFRSQEIAATLGQRATHPLHWFPLLASVYPAFHLEGTTWQKDRDRIANFYAVRGYFDARVTGSQLKRKKQTRPDGSPLFVEIFHSVKEGPLSRVREVEVVLAREPALPGAAGGSPWPQRSPEQDEALRQELVQRVGRLSSKPFSMASTQAAEGELVKLLASKSYAEALVSSRVDAYPEEQVVDIRFDVQTGRPAVFGPHRLSGLAKVREQYVLRHIKFREGDDYNGSLVNRTQQAIYNMGLFSMVTVVPDLAASSEAGDGRKAVPLDIRLRERKPRSRKLKVGVGWQVDRIDAKVTGGLSHLNLFRRLLQAHVDLTAGYAFLGVDDHGPVGSLGIDLRWPDFPVRTLTLESNAEIGLDVQKGYKFWSPVTEVGVTWAPWKPLKLHLAYSLSYNDLFPNHRLEELAAVSPQLALSDGYILSFFDQSVVLDLRDQPLAPSRGFLLQLNLIETASPRDAPFHYIRLQGEMRGYVPMGTPRIVLAARVLGAGVHHLMEGKTELPVNHRVYAGGDGSVRGWKSKYLGPRLVEVVEPDEEQEFESQCGRSDCIVPLGGRLGMTGSLELRGNPVAGLWLSVFTDFGRVWEWPRDLAEDGLAPPEGLQFSVGGGVRYDTPIGRLRLDIAVHPRAWTDDEFLGPGWVHRDRERQPSTWNFHFGIGESF